MNERITIDPRIHFGKPTVSGTRITVRNVIELVDFGLSPQEIVGDYYPDLSVADVQECIEIDRSKAL